MDSSGNEWVKGKCGKPKINCANCNAREFFPVTDLVIRNHLLGNNPNTRSNRDFTIGIYPLLQDETCYFLAADFDKAIWLEDAAAFLDTCKTHSIPAYLERSRSGNGGHVWIFFSEPTPATIARKMGSFILTETMENRPEIGFDSYDRFFPNQDTMPKGGFGNLIALPLQKKPREMGNSVFLDANFIPHIDQWAYLSSIRRMNKAEVEAVVDEAVRKGSIVGVRMVLTDEDDDKPWTAPPSRKRKKAQIKGPFPKKITLVMGNQLFVPKEDLSPSLQNALIRIPAFQNPEFYKAQAMRFPTFDKPRIIGCAENFSKHIGIPRGSIEDVMGLLESLKIEVEIKEERNEGSPLNIEFSGVLRPEQKMAAQSMLEHDTGVLSASTAFGKTVIAIYMIAVRNVNTLILVHRRQILDQWVARLGGFLNVDAGDIGQIGGGKRKPTGKIDVALVQSLSKKDVVDDIVGEYGHLIVDECHHISARSFENVTKQAKAKFVTGLSATVTRKDGHHPIIFMQCGPVRYRVDDRKQAEKRPFGHKVVMRPTGFQMKSPLHGDADPTIHDYYTALMKDEQRNMLILKDLLDAIKEGRSPVVLTERKEHLQIFMDLIENQVQHVIALKGGMGKKQRVAISDRIASIGEEGERVIIATGKYLGEGFDDSRLDTLFLTLPVSWRGTVAQYAGRLHRLNDMKKEVVIYDYADLDVPMMAKMYERRRRGYLAIGYEIEEE
ncbi:TOTE conflict system archaeo-eukaryotic primase domain-containing protein [Desulfatibacillum alkenivorans]|nr:DEAD/DEAH box helicase [Desulfatibacillum alkenivorans]